MIDLGTVVRFKMDNTKVRVTFAPIIAAGEHLHNWKPVFISKQKGSDPILKKIPFRPIHMSGFLGQALFGKNGKVRIFWTSPVWQKRKSPDFLESGF